MAFETVTGTLKHVKSSVARTGGIVLCGAHRWYHAVVV